MPILLIHVSSIFLNLILSLFHMCSVACKAQKHIVTTGPKHSCESYCERKQVLGISKGKFKHLLSYNMNKTDNVLIFSVYLLDKLLQVCWFGSTILFAPCLVWAVGDHCHLLEGDTLNPDGLSISLRRKTLLGVSRTNVLELSLSLPLSCDTWA